MNKNDLVDFGNGIIKLNQSLNPNNDVNGELQTLKTNYENSGSDADLYKFCFVTKFIFLMIFNIDNFSHFTWVISIYHLSIFRHHFLFYDRCIPIF